MTLDRRAQQTQTQMNESFEQFLSAIIEQCRDLHAAVHEVYIEYPIEVAFEA